jgi:L-lactate dehydrogenase
MREPVSQLTHGRRTDRSQQLKLPVRWRVGLLYAHKYMKIGIVGMGWVGASVAISVLQSGLASELLLCDTNRELAQGEAMDLAHGAAFYPAAAVRAAELGELTKVDAVVVAAGRGGSPGESRLDLLRDNAAIVAAIARDLRTLSGLLVIVTNPVDVMTQIACEASGLPPERVIGTGTMLDTARLRQVLGRELELEPRSVHAQVIGEHGDSEVVLWSSARIGGIPLRHWPGWSSDRETALATEVRVAAREIIGRKGATNHAIGLVTAALLRWSLRGERRVLTVSRVQAGAHGLRDVALSLPCVVGVHGATQVLEPEMEPAESEALQRSAEILRSARRSALGHSGAAG